MRLFVSIDLPERLADAVAAAQEPLSDANGLRVTDPDQTHVTLKFLGNVPDQRIAGLTDALSGAVEAASIGPFSATIGGLGAFPSTDYIRVVWLGVREGAAEMTQLHDAIESATVELGFSPETYDFTPHVTIARMEHAGGKELVQETLRTENPTVGEFRVTDVRLTESVLTDDGPVYSTVERFSL